MCTDPVNVESGKLVVDDLGGSPNCIFCTEIGFFCAVFCYAELSLWKLYLSTQKFNIQIQNSIFYMEIEFSTWKL